MLVLLAIPVPVLLFGLLGWAILFFVLWKKRQDEKARVVSMESLARTLDCSFSAQDTFGLAKQLQGFDLFKRERSRWRRQGKVSNVLRGKVGDTDVYLFDYTYTVQAGNTPKRIRQTVFFANDKNWYLPNFKLRPERWWHKLQHKLGVASDINFGENPDFSDKFWLKSEFEDLVRQQFTPALRGFLAEKPPAHLEGDNYYLIAYKPKKRLDSPEAYLFFQHCCEVVKMLQQEGKMELLNLSEVEKPETGPELTQTRVEAIPKT